MCLSLSSSLIQQTIGVFDSFYININNKTLECRILCMPDINVPSIQKQNGIKDCELFAIAFTVFLIIEKKS